MKKYLLALPALAIAACQQHSGPAAGAAPPAAPQAVAVSQRPARPAQLTVAAPADTAAFLRRYDLAAILQNRVGQPEGQVQAMNGFYGPDHYRLEVALTTLERDPQYPNHYLVRGKDRYKGVVTPLTGSVTLTRVQVHKFMATDADGKPVPTASYAVLGTYELREDPATRGAGIFRGQVAVDMSLYEEKPVSESTSDSVSRGGMTTYSGTWTSLATRQQKAAIWVANLFTYRGPQIASDFFIGERDPSINPKYAKLGWNKYWENDEWWVDLPGAVASTK